MFSINGVFWTMAVEAQFYALLPVLAGIAFWCSRCLGPLRATAALFVGLLIASSAAAKVVNPVETA